jgi:hypothetical protein
MTHAKENLCLRSPTVADIYAEKRCRGYSANSTINLNLTSYVVRCSVVAVSQSSQSLSRRSLSQVN